MDIKQFIIELAVNAFNIQFTRSFDYKDFDVITIRNNPNSHCAFEVYTTRFDDNLRFRLYVTLGNINHVGTYILKEQIDNYVGTGDELFVADAVLDQEFLYLNNNQIRQANCSIDHDVTKLKVLIKENGDALLLENGDFILLEDN